MSRSSNDSSWGRRKSLLALSALTSSSSAKEEDPANGEGTAGGGGEGGGAGGGSAASKPSKRPKPNRISSLFTEIAQRELARETDGVNASSAPVDSSRRQRPSLSVRVSSKRPSSVFSNLRIPLRSTSSQDELAGDAVGEPLSSVSTSAPSDFGDGVMEEANPVRTVQLHGEAQTSAGLFRKKKEYLVLTESHILRYKSQAKASEAWTVIPPPGGKPTYTKHGSMPSVGSQSDLYASSDTSGDKNGRVALRHVVAAYSLDDGKTHSALEISYLDEKSGYAFSLTLQWSSPDERDVWLRYIRSTCAEARQQHHRTILASNIEHVARAVERDHDYDPANCAVYKVMQRQPPARLGRSSSDDLTKVASAVCFLAIGVHKVHIVQLVKPSGRTSSASLHSNISIESYGILTLTAIKVGAVDDSLELTFRQPLQRPRHLLLASYSSHEIAARLHDVENFLRPEIGQRLLRFNVPPEVDKLLSVPVLPDEEHKSLDRTLSAYCVAYGLNPSNVRYTIDYDCEDAPRFELLPLADPRRSDYGPIALLAIMRALRNNESFGSISFAGISLDSLNGLHDDYGKEHVCLRTKLGTPIKLSAEELGRASLLVQEVRALAATSKKLRRMDFSNCISEKIVAGSLEPPDEENPKARDIGCGIIEALVPLCKQQTTNVDWICLNGILLSDKDMDYLISAAVDKSCHFRALELNRCGLNDRSMGLILDALRAQDNTIEAIEIGGNTARLNPATFDSQLSIFGFIRKLNLSYVPRTSGAEPLLTAETLLVWRLQELRFSGTVLNRATIDAVATYLAHPQSRTLHELYFDNAFLSGADVATLLHSLSRDSEQHRDLHLDISQNHLTKNLEEVTQAIASNKTPSHFSMRAIEYREESLFRKMIAALTVNKTIRYLDISQSALPGDAGEETCRALHRLFAENDTLVELDLSGEDSRLASSRIGTGINQALMGLTHNQSLQCLRLERQKLGLQGASTLAEVLKENETLRELHCANNEIPLHGLTDLVNSLIDNTTLVYLPAMDDGRSAAFKSAEKTMRAMSNSESPVSPSSSHSRPPSSLSGAAGVKRGLASVRRSAARTASAYTPSFPALQSYNRSPKSSIQRHSQSQISLTLPTARRRQSLQSPNPAPVSFSVQDIQTTQRLLTEQWDRQVFRLSQYLERNWRFLHDLPVEMEIEDEKFERPASVASIGKLLEQVKCDSTPRNEKELYFDTPQEKASPPSTSSTSSTSSSAPVDPAPPLQQPRTTTLTDEKLNLSFKHFILESGPASPSIEVDDHSQVRSQVRMDMNLDHFDEPTTPTQKGFTV